ncbi:MAG: tRNA dihydrouridine(20/20a) synthase DusA [Agarilytica sp.]
MNQNTQQPGLDHHRFCIAPMMEWSDRHCRFLWRLLTKQSFLYTEMVTSGALIHNDPARFLTFNTEEHPLALQVGGSTPKDLAHCAELAEKWQYNEINLNCGCPSDRVQSGKIGAILMAEPKLVADCVRTMVGACDIPVTVKHRLGIDDMEDYEDMKRFVLTVADAGCNTFIVHARKAWLKGLSPKENREVPPLKYDLVYRLKEELPELRIVINGGISTIAQSETLLEHVDGVMIGREAYNNPYFLKDIDHEIFNLANPSLDRKQVVERYIEYCEQQIHQGQRLHFMSRHILGLFQGQPRARLFRKHISEHAHKPGATADVLREALAIVA